ncbi:hypothetical protein NQZ68_021644 [Dissostichus eleginoides]|nr:hypothetical protein NQZ68_021644 [Dissostichus eleginoides]
MWEAAQAPCRHHRNQNHDKLRKDKQPSFTSGVSALNCLQVEGFCCHKISTFLKRRAVMFEEEPANTTGDILAAARADINDEADDIPAFIDLSVLIRDFLCKQGWGPNAVVMIESNYSSAIAEVIKADLSQQSEMQSAGMFHLTIQSIPSEKQSRQMINDQGGTTEEGERFTNMEKLEKERRGWTEEEQGVRGPKISWCGGSASAATGVAVLAVYRPAHEIAEAQKSEARLAGLFVEQKFIIGHILSSDDGSAEKSRSDGEGGGSGHPVATHSFEENKLQPPGHVPGHQALDNPKLLLVSDHSSSLFSLV